MFSEKSFCIYFFCILIGFLTFLQQTEGNASSAGASSAKTYFFYQSPTYPRDCKEVLGQYPGKNSSGVFLIKPDGYPHPFEVYCHNSFDSGGWTVFMRRLDGSLIFSRNWSGYKEGFGFLSSEFWLGNDKLAFLTNQKMYELRVDLTVSNGSHGFVMYSHFRVSDEWGNYTLATLSNATGNIDFLTPTCPTNMILTNCTCERTCEAPTICQNNCQEAGRCVCPDGFYLRGSDCVSPEDCECYSTTAGKVISIGESYINNLCSQECSCSASGFTCSDYSCNSNARCMITGEGGRCTCNTGFVGDGINCGCNTGYLVDESSCRRPRDCAEVPSVAGYNGSGLYYILPSNWQEFKVYCNMSEGRWTVFQRRIPGSDRNFKLSWNSYKRGFGELDEDFWLGNDKIHYLTSQQNYQLRIDIIDSGNRHYRAQYNGFRIGNEGSKYRMTVLGTFSGTAGYDAMRHHFNQPFSTHDRDNDDSEGYHCYYDIAYDYFYYCYYSYPFRDNCAHLHGGAWWYKNRNRVFSSSGCDYFTDSHNCCDSSCYNCGTHSYSCAFSNLNGKEGGSPGQTIFWHGHPGNDCGIKYTEMKVRPLP